MLQMVVEVVVPILVELLKSVFFLDLFFVGEFLQMVPWDENHHKTTIWDKIFV